MCFCITLIRRYAKESRPSAGRISPQRHKGHKENAKLKLQDAKCLARTCKHILHFYPVLRVLCVFVVNSDGFVPLVFDDVLQNIFDFVNRAKTQQSLDT